MLKAFIEKLEDLPEATRALYAPITEGDHAGKFVLKVEPVNGFALENVDGLKNALGTTKSELEAAKAAVDGFKGLDAKDVRQKLKDYDRLSKIDPETEAGKLAEVKLQQAIEQINTKHAGEVDVLNKRSDSLKNVVTNLLVNETAKAEILKAKGVPELLLGTVTSRMKVIEADDGTFSVQVLNEKGLPDFVAKEGTAVPATVEDLVTKLKANPIYGRAFDGSGRSGGGANPNNPGNAGGFQGKNPFITGNLTEQMRVMKSDPALAAALQAQADGMNAS